MSHWLTSPLSLTWYAAAAAKSLQSCPTLCDPIDSSPPGPAVQKASYMVPLLPHWTLCLVLILKPNNMTLWKCTPDHKNLLAQNPPVAPSVTPIKCPTFTLICKTPHNLASWSFLITFPGSCLLPLSGPATRVSQLTLTMLGLEALPQYFPLPLSLSVPSSSHLLRKTFSLSLFGL